MEIEPQKSLRAAFVHLDAFSVPGIGTFVRRHIPAKIDPKTQRIHPPRQRFALETGEAKVDQLKDFFRNHFQLKEGIALKMVSEVRSWMVRDLKGKGKLTIEGIGELRLVGGKELKFQPTNDPGKFPDPFFGLMDIPYAGATGQSGISSPKVVPPTAKVPKEKPLKETPPAEKKPPQKIAAVSPPPAHIPTGKTPAQETTAVQAAAVATPPAKPKQKKERRIGWWIIPIIVLLFLGVMGMAFHKEINRQLQAWGWVEDGRSAVLADNNDHPDAADATPNDSGTVADTGNNTGFEPDPTEDSDNSHAPEETPDPEETASPKETPDPVVVAPEETQPQEDPNSDSDSPPVGNFAQSGIYYLVVASIRDAKEAARIARRDGGKVLRPRGRGYYKIYVYSAPNKSDVIAQMVARKEKFSKSWIYWLGM